MSDSPYGVYTKHEYGRLQSQIQKYRLAGQPELAQRLRMQMQADIPFDEIKLPDAPSAPEVRPETNIESGLVEVPPRTGKGSGTQEWRAFAKLVTDIDGNVIDSLGRNELIGVLEDRGVIDKEELPED